MPDIPRNPIQSLFIKHPLSTPHCGFGHCRNGPVPEKPKGQPRGLRRNPGERQAGCLRQGVQERSPHPHPEVVTVPGKRWPQGAQQALFPQVRRGPSWEGNGKELASLDHTRAPLPQGAGPRLRPPGDHQAQHRTPVRAGAGCHWLPSPSPATTAGDSLPSMTVTAAADRASQVRRLHSPGRRLPLLPRAEGGSTGKIARALPLPPPSPGLWKSGYLARGGERGRGPEEEKEKEDRSLRPRQI